MLLGVPKPEMTGATVAVKPTACPKTELVGEAMTEEEVTPLLTAKLRVLLLPK